MRDEKHLFIMRGGKLNGWSAVANSAGHTWRTTPVPYADPARTHLNQDWREVSSPKALRSALEERHELATADQDRRRSREWERTAARAQTSLEDERAAHADTVGRLEEMTGGLNDGQIQKIAAFREKCLARRAEKQQRDAEQARPSSQPSPAPPEQQSNQPHQARIDELVVSSRYMSAEDVLGLSDEDRRSMWREIAPRNDMERRIERFVASGLLGVDGEPTQKGRCFRDAADAAIENPSDRPARFPVYYVMEIKR